MSAPDTWPGSPAAASAARSAEREPSTTRHPGEGEAAGEAAPLLAGAAEHGDGEGGRVEGRGRAGGRGHGRSLAGRPARRTSEVAGQAGVPRAEGEQAPANGRENGRWRAWTSSRRRRRRAPPRQRETAADALPGARSADGLDALLRDVEGLRRVLETDLSLAASATEAGALDVAADVVDADRAELARFSAARPCGASLPAPRP